MRNINDGQTFIIGGNVDDKSFKIELSVDSKAKQNELWRVNIDLGISQDGIIQEMPVGTFVAHLGTMQSDGKFDGEFTLGQEKCCN